MLISDLRSGSMCWRFGGSVLTPVFAGACSAIPGFQPTLTGGDGGSLPLCEYLDMVWYLTMGSGSLLDF